jgi:hypothetical protein
MELETAILNIDSWTTSMDAYTRRAWAIIRAALAEVQNPARSRGKSMKINRKEIYDKYGGRCVYCGAELEAIQQTNEGRAAMPAMGIVPEHRYAGRKSGSAQTTSLRHNFHATCAKSCNVFEMCPEDTIYDSYVCNKLRAV